MEEVVKETGCMVGGDSDANSWVLESLPFA